MDLNNPLVSIIILNYNHEKFLNQRINSILNQTFQDFELILMDDKSSDNSLKILNKYTNHQKVSHIVVNESNSGSPFKQLVKGLNICKGSFIWIAESDDYSEPDFLEKTIGLFRKDNKLSLVYTDSKIVDASGKEIGLWKNKKNFFFKSDKWSKDYVNLGLNEIVETLLFKCTINNMSAVLFRKKDLLNIDLAKLVEFKNVGDLYVYSMTILDGNIGYISEPLNNYREHSENLTKKNLISGTLYKERIEYLNKVLSVLELENVNSSKFNFSIGSFLIKNIFFALDFKYYRSVFDLLKRLKKCFFRRKINYYKVYGLLIIYSIIPRTRIRSFTKQILKKEIVTIVL